MAAKTRWLDRTLVLGPYLCLCLNESEYKRAAKHIGWPEDGDIWCNSGGGRTHMVFDCPEPAAIVCIDVPDAGYVAVAGLLAHEATHIWLDWLRSMGEDKPGDEITAYAIQNLTVLLMDEWYLRVGKERDTACKTEPSD
jgi:hypothetical protein